MNAFILLYLYIVISLFAFVFYNLFTRIALRNTKYEFAFTVLWQFLTGIFALPFLFFEKITVSADILTIAVFSLSLMALSLSDAFTFIAYKYEEASVLAGIFPLYNVMAIMIAVVFFGSLLTGSTAVGFLMIVAATIMVSNYHKKLVVSTGTFFAIIACVFTAIAVGMSGKVVQSFSVGFYNVAAFIVPGLLNYFIFLRPKPEQLQYELKHRWKMLLLTACTASFAYYFLFKAIKIGNPAEVIAVQSSSTVFIALGAIIFLKERKNMAFKLLAAVIAMCGVIFTQY